MKKISMSLIIIMLIAIADVTIAYAAPSASLEYGSHVSESQQKSVTNYPQTGESECNCLPYIMISTGVNISAIAISHYYRVKRSRKY